MDHRVVAGGSRRHRVLPAFPGSLMYVAEISFIVMAMVFAATSMLKL